MFDKFYASVKIAVSFIFVVFEMEKKKILSVHCRPAAIARGRPPKRVSALDAAVETRCTWSPIFLIFLFCPALEIPLRKGVVTRFLFLLGRRPLSPAFPATRSRLFALSFPQRSLGSWPQSISFAASRKANFPRPVLPRNTLLNRVRARTVSCARVAMISNLATVPFRVDFFFSPFPKAGSVGEQVF